VYRNGRAPTSQGSRLATLGILYCVKE
jgi:hypothetical protein